MPQKLAVGHLVVDLEALPLTLPVHAPDVEQVHVAVAGLGVLQIGPVACRGNGCW